MGLSRAMHPGAFCRSVGDARSPPPSTSRTFPPCSSIAPQDPAPGGLHIVQSVEHHHPRDHGDLVVDRSAALLVSAEYLKGRLLHASSSAIFLRQHLLQLIRHLRKRIPGATSLPIRRGDDIVVFPMLRIGIRKVDAAVGATALSPRERAASSPLPTRSTWTSDPAPDAIRD